MNYEVKLVESQKSLSKNVENQYVIITTACNNIGKLVQGVQKTNEMLKITPGEKFLYE